MSKCRVLMESGGVSVYSSCFPDCDSTTADSNQDWLSQVKTEGNVCESDKSVTDRTATSAAAGGGAGGAVGTAAQTSDASTVKYCIWGKKCATGQGRCGVMDLGQDSGGVVTVCACGGSDELSRIRETMQGNVCAGQRAKEAADASLVPPPAVRVTAVLSGMTMETFGSKEDEFVQSVAQAAGVELLRVMILSVIETSARRRASGVQVVTEIETDTPESLQGTFTEGSFSAQLVSRGLPPPSSMNMKAVEPAKEEAAAASASAVTDSTEASSTSALQKTEDSVITAAESGSLSITAIAAGVGAGAGVIVLGVAAGIYVRSRAKAAAEPPAVDIQIGVGPARVEPLSSVTTVVELVNVQARLGGGGGGGFEGGEGAGFNRAGIHHEC